MTAPVEPGNESAGPGPRDGDDVAGQLRALQRSFFADRGHPDHEVEDAMIAEIDRTLDVPDRTRSPAGTVLFQEGERLDRIWILISGRVRLYKRIESREVTLHSRTVGRIIGLLSIAEARPSFFNCRAETDIEFIELTIEELDWALQHSPTLAVHLVSVALRSLGRRNMRAVDLQLEIHELNLTLTKERDHLADVIHQLENAHTHLIESAKMATLGQLVAGMAHELNNPVAAIVRAAEHVGHDIESIAREHAGATSFAPMLHTAVHQEPLSTREERQRRDDLAATLGDARLAQRLVRIGIRTPEDYLEQVGGVGADEAEARLHDMELFYHVGASLRNISSCAQRISDLVTSLRSYARGPEETPVEADVHTGIEETLLLFGHRLHGIDVERDYADLPTMRCRPGRLNQVWTNLVSNALEALGGEGTLRIVTETPDTETVRVRVEDTGSGIPADRIEEIFEPHYTSKQGRVDFGLGLGLPISRDIVLEHGGRIAVESRPGHTSFSVTLPIHPSANGE